MDFLVKHTSESQDTLNWVSKILKDERNIEISSKALETASLSVENIKWVFVFYESGLAINVLYPLDNRH